MGYGRARWVFFFALFALPLFGRAGREGPGVPASVPSSLLGFPRGAGSPPSNPPKTHIDMHSSESAKAVRHIQKKRSCRCALRLSQGVGCRPRKKFLAVSGRRGTRTAKGARDNEWPNPYSTGNRLSAGDFKNLMVWLWVGSGPLRAFGRALSKKAGVGK